MIYDILYEISDASDGGELAEKFLNKFLDDIGGLDYSIESLDQDMKDGTVAVTLKTQARLSSAGLSNAATVVGK